MTPKDLVSALAKMQPGTKEYASALVELCNIHNELAGNESHRLSDSAIMQREMKKYLGAVEKHLENSVTSSKPTIAPESNKEGIIERLKKFFKF